MKFTDYIQKIDEGKADKILDSIDKAKTRKELAQIRDIVLFQMDLPENTRKKIKLALNNKMRLTEERIHSKDKRAIISYIKNPKSDDYKMKDGDTFKVKTNNNGTTFEFDKENFELAMTITDLIDALGGYKMKSSPGKIIVLPKGMG